MIPRPYNPARQANVSVNDPLEVELAFNVSSCGTCSFFWPTDVSKQPYGPYPSFDFIADMPAGNPPPGDKDYKWLEGVTTGPGFPTGEIMDGCRKAPIMTIGINPNLTAFLPGQQGASWVYPNFTGNNGKNMWANYAYYYRYRSIFQEHLNFDILKNYFVPGSEIKAAKSGTIVDAQRSSNAPSYTIHVKYDGDTVPVKINLTGTLGTPPFVLLFNPGRANSKFNAGDIIAARLDVPAGIKLDIFQEPISYYEQFMPALAQFERFLKTKGVTGANLVMGEDVCQLDMVACASPHWTDQYLGGSALSENTVINNCVSKNAWAIKQLVQTKPAVLYLVGESSYIMFKDAFSNLIKKNTPLSEKPEDGAFTLFKQCLDTTDPCMFNFSANISGQDYTISTRLVVTPHFSYSSNFLPQFRISQQAWAAFMHNYHDCYTYLFNSPDVQYIKPQVQNGFVAIALINNVPAVLSELNTAYSGAYNVLKPTYYDPHSDMAAVLEELFTSGKIAYIPAGTSGGGHLTRTEGSCKFCVNSHWAFPQGCPYGNNNKPAPANGFLRAVANEMVAKGKPAQFAEATLISGSLFVER